MYVRMYVCVCVCVCVILYMIMTANSLLSLSFFFGKIHDSYSLRKHEGTIIIMYSS